MLDNDKIISLIKKYKAGDDKAFLELGLLYYGEDIYNIAYKFMKKAVDKGVKGALGDIFITLCKKNDQIDEYKFYLKKLSNELLDNGYPWYLELLMEQYILENDFELALRCCLEAYEIKSSDSFLERMIFIYIELYKRTPNEDYIKKIEQLIHNSLKLKSPIGLEFLAEYCLDKGFYSRAIKYYKVLNTLNHITHNIEIADIYAYQGKYDKAKEYYQLAYELKERGSSLKLGLVLRHSEREKGIEYLLEASKKGHLLSITLLEQVL